MVSRTIFDPVTYGGITAANRLVMAAMPRNQATPEGHATGAMADYYAQRASAGLIITEGTQPNQQGQGFAKTPGIYTEAQAQSWRNVTDAVHQRGGRIAVQMSHAGRIGHPALYDSGHTSVAPSAIRASGQTATPKGMTSYQTPLEMGRVDITQTIKDFATAARFAISAGFDGVEIQAGNGFLLHQFMAQNTNQRRDTYGGSLTNRVRFAVEVAESVSKAIGPDRTGLRISPGSPDNDIAEGDTGALYATLIKNLPQLAFLDIMETNNRSMTREIRRHWKGPVILNPHAGADHWPAGTGAIDPVLRENLADGVSFGALFQADPDLVDRVGNGARFN